MFQDFNQILQRMKLLDEDKQVLLAVSGGVDSIVLFKLMQSIPITNRPKLHIAHINHQLRSEADAEENFVKELAKKHQVPFYSYRWPKNQHPKNGIEEAARKIRYTFFKQLMKEQNLDVLMTGHHQDDQVETILMKLTRGSVLEQLTGIDESQSFSEGKLVRPLLSFQKEALIAFANEERLDYMEDETNFEPIYMRNRFRNEIIPLLKEENEQFNQHVEQFAVDLNDLLEVSKQSVQETFHQVVMDEEDKLILNIFEYSKQSPAYQRVVLKELLNVLYHDEGIGYKSTYVPVIQNWIMSGDVNTQLDLQNDFVAIKEYETVCFMKASVQTKTIEKNPERVIQRINEWVKLSATEKIGLFVLESKEESAAYLKEEDTLLISEEALKLPLRVRHRKPGDRMHYAGLGGTKKIKDIFIDEKTPAKERDQAWIVEDSAEDILWLISYRKMHLFTAQETDKLTYILIYKKV